MSASVIVDLDCEFELARVTLDNRLQTRTGRRLRHLTVAPAAGRIRISAVAPLYHVRQLAEQAALTVLPAEQLDLAIEVSAHPQPFEDAA